MSRKASITKVTLEGTQPNGQPYKKVLDLSASGEPLDAIAFTTQGVQALGAWYETFGGGKEIDYQWVLNHFGAQAADQVVGKGQSRKVTTELLMALWNCPKQNPGDATPAFMAKTAVSNPTNG